MLEFLVLVGPLAIIVTKVVDTLRNAVDPNGTRPKVWWNIAALVIGVGVALLWEVDFKSAIEGLPPALAKLDGVWGQVITGLGIGAMSSGWHELFDLVSGAAGVRQAQVKRGA